MYTYIDESGNTGLDLFSDQPIFSVGSLMSIQDLETSLGPIIESHKQRLGVPRIHAVDLNKTDLNAIFDDIKTELDFTSKKWLFSLSRMDKKYYLSCQFFDTFFDSGINASISNSFYYDPGTKHASCMALEQVLTIEDKRIFWEALKRNKINTLGPFLITLTEKMTQCSISGVEHLIDGISYAINNLDDFNNDKMKPKKGENSSLIANSKDISPNGILYFGAIHKIHQYCNQHSVQSSKIIVDNETTFNPVFKRGRAILEGVYIPNSENYEFSALMKESALPLGELEILASSKSVGLQVVDVLLYAIVSDETKLKRLQSEDHLDYTEISFIASATILKEIMDKYKKYMNQRGS